MLCLLTPISLIDRHSHARELGNIISRKCHIVLVEHLQSAHNIVLCKAVDLLLAHIIVWFKQGESIPAQLRFVYVAFLSVNGQRHDSVEPMAHTDLIGDPMQPPIIEIPLHRPAPPALLLYHPALIPVRILLLRLGQRQTALSHERLYALLLTVTVWDIIKQLLQLHRTAIPIGHHRIVLSQLCAGSHHTKTLQNALHLRFTDGRGKPVPDLPGKGIFQFLQNFLILWIHGNRLGQHIIQVQPCPAVYYEGCFGNNILVHLMQRVTKLRHTYAVQIKHHRIEIPGILPTALPTKIRDGGHYCKIRVPNILQLLQLVRDHMTVGFAVSLNLQRNAVFRRHHQRNTISLRVLKVASALK